MRIQRPRGRLRERHQHAGHRPRRHAYRLGRHRCRHFHPGQAFLPDSSATAFSTWDNNATIVPDRRNYIAGSAGTSATSWQNDQWTLSTSAITFGAAPITWSQTLTYQPVLLGAYSDAAKTTPIPNFDITQTGQGTCYLDIGFTVHAGGLDATQEIGATTFTINPGALQPAGPFTTTTYPSVTVGTGPHARTYSFPTATVDSSGNITYSPTIGTMAATNAGKPAGTYNPFLIGDELFQWDGTPQSPFTMTPATNTTTGATTKRLHRHPPRHHHSRSQQLLRHHPNPNPRPK